MTTFRPHNRTHCADCGTPRHAHAPGTLECPVIYRPADLRAAQADYDAAVRSGDPERIFVARGEVQRLEGRP